MVVPSVVGLDLQLAQDTMQAVGFYLLRSRDATGQERRQVLDRNWKVCRQTPSGGSSVTLAQVITFDVVGDIEACP